MCARPPTNCEYGDEPLAAEPAKSDGGSEFGRQDDLTRELPVAPATPSEDRCGACGAPLAHDQRYCVECGDRRGQSRLPVAQPATEVQSRRVRTARAPRAPRASAGATLVAGVGVLLLAVGLGFLIGHNANNNTTTKAQTPASQVITVQEGGAGSGTNAAAATTTTAASSTPKGLSGKLKKAAAATAPPSAAVQKKANAAASKVLGNSKNLAPPTVTTGGSCRSGAGCQGGHFTGNFFGN